MNRIDQAFQQKKNILNIYFTAGFPSLNDTTRIIRLLEQSGGVDMIEIGIPYSDPVADGPTIQESNQRAIKNGMTLKKLFEQLSDLRSYCALPIILMGYINPVMQYGIEKFLQKCTEIGIDGTILPDLPFQEFLDDYKALYQKYGIYNIFLISPQTSEERLRKIDTASEGFIYMVSSNSITGAKQKQTEEQIKYFQRIANMNLRNPRLIGFGISNRTTFENACKYAHGAIIGSAFIQLLSKHQDNLEEAIPAFIKEIRG
ncbi:MAG: tryptophan synthase subunit alpha [Cytophagales bacterium]|nr:tryptophan synthase subunit alpha [Cytophagales bacterium]MDW8383633.1 tryptophan synthase subunit alpha [Flammeovirgaceae bacterium]